MAEIEERLVPRDGLNNYNIVLARLDMPTHGGAQFTFAVTNSMLLVAELAVNVPASGQSLDRMTVEAHDALIDIMRQLMFRAEKARGHHVRHADRPLLHGQDDQEPDDDALEFALDRRNRTDRRVEEIA